MVFNQALIKRQLFGAEFDDDIALDQRATVQRLAQFFPELGSGHDSGIYGGWAFGIAITFIADNGQEYTVHVDQFLKLWREGRGDMPVHLSFRDFILNLFEDYDSRK